MCCRAHLFMQPGMLQTMEYDSMKVILMCLPNAKGDMLNINVSIVGSCSLDGYGRSVFLVGWEISLNNGTIGI